MSHGYYDLGSIISGDEFQCRNLTNLFIYIITSSCVQHSFYDLGAKFLKPMVGESTVGECYSLFEAGG
jgi:hypothetical protein